VLFVDKAPRVCDPWRDVQEVAGRSGSQSLRSMRYMLPKTIKSMNRYLLQSQTELGVEG
jgi:hypothetical protein